MGSIDRAMAKPPAAGLVGDTPFDRGGIPSTEPDLAPEPDPATHPACSPEDADTRPALPATEANGKDRSEDTVPLPGEAKRTTAAHGKQDPAHGPAREQTALSTGDSPPDMMIGKYELLDLLGHGGMGDVYLARFRQMKVDRIVALKIIRRSLGIAVGPRATRREVARFEVEMMAATRLEHENIVPVYEVGEHQGIPYFSMLHVDGPSLGDLLREGPLPGLEAATLLEPIARAVHTAHSKGIIHRDIKPSNILIDGHGKPYLSDFGLAKPLEHADTLTQTDMLLGSPPYMAPEQVRDSSRVTTSCDVYGLGATLYEMLTGRPPFRAADPIETLRQVVDELPVPPRRLNHDVPRDLETISLLCLEKDPTRRLTSADRLAEELRRFIDGRPIQSRPLPAWEHVFRWVRRRPAITGLIASVILAVVLGFTATMIQLRNTERARAALAKTNELLEFRAYQDRIGMAAEMISAGKLADAEKQLEGCPEGLRAWEWRHLRRRCHDKLMIMAGNSGPLCAVAFSPKGGAVVTGGHHGAVTIWDPRDGHKLTELRGVPDSVVVRDVCWGVTADNKDRIAAACGDGSLHIWVGSEGSWEPVSAVPAHTQAINDIDFSPDATTLASAGDDGRIVLWDTSRLGSPRSLREKGPAVLGIRFGRRGGSLAAVAEDKSLSRWDLLRNNADPLCTLDDIGLAVACSPDGKLLAVAGSDGKITIWDSSKPEARIVVRGHYDGVNAVTFSPSGDRLASAGADRAVKLWDTRSWREVLSLRDHSDPVEALAFSPDGQLLASVGSDGKLIVRNAAVWDQPPPPPPVSLIGHQGPVTCLSIDGLRRRIATAGTDGTIRIWDADSGDLVRVLDSDQNKISGLAFSPDGQRLGSAGRDGSVWLWDLGQPNSVGRPLGSHRGRCIAMAFFPDGRFLASAGADAAIRLWRVEGDPALDVLPAREEVYALAISADGSQLASGGAETDGTITLWDLRTPGSPRRRALHGHERQINGLAFSPDGGTLVSVSHDSTARVWELATDRVSAVLGGHLSRVWGVAVSPDGRHVATAGGDWTIHIWDPVSGRDEATLLGHQGRVRAVAFDPCNGGLVSVSDDGLVNLWHASRWQGKEPVEPSQPRLATRPTSGLPVHPSAAAPL